jgi:hypothetical protein
VSCPFTTRESSPTSGTMYAASGCRRVTATGKAWNVGRSGETSAHVRPPSSERKTPVCAYSQKRSGFFGSRRIVCMSKCAAGSTAEATFASVCEISASPTASTGSG